MPDSECAPPMTLAEHTEWYHGSPVRLDTLAVGSTVTPLFCLAKAFASKPTRVSIDIRDDSETGDHTVTIKHDGKKPGYLFRVLVTNPREDLEQHPGSRMAAGEEMLSKRELRLEFLEEVPLQEEYSFTEKRR